MSSISSAPGPVLDVSILEGLEAATGPATARLVGIFLRELERQRLPQLAAAAAQSDLDGLREIGHALKSSAGTYGAVHLQHLAAELEVAARDGDAERCADLSASIRAGAASTRSALEARYGAVADN